MLHIRTAVPASQLTHAVVVAFAARGGRSDVVVSSGSTLQVLLLRSRFSEEAGLVDGSAQEENVDAARSDFSPGLVRPHPLLGGTLRDMRALRLPGRSHEVLLCATESGTLTLLDLECVEGTAMYRFKALNEKPYSRPGMSKFLQDVHLLQVDPMSRAVAMFALSGRFALVLLEPEYAASEPELGAIGSIFDKESFADEHASIIDAAFLHPEKPTSPISIVVLNCSNVDQKFYLSLWRYWPANPANPISLVARLPLGQAPMPLHVVALPLLSESLLLVDETKFHLINAKDIINGNVNYAAKFIPSSLKEESPAARIRKPPLYNCFHACKFLDPTASSDAQVQSVYCANELGQVALLTLVSRSEIQLCFLNEESCVGSFAALAVIERAHVHGADILFLPGAMSDGAVFSVDSSLTQPVPIIQTLHNWSPIIDIQVADFYNDGHNVVFAVSGIHPDGAVTEIRSGTQVMEFSKTDPDYEDASHVWTVPFQDSKAIILSFLQSTRMVMTSDDEYIDYSEQSSLKIDECTLGVTTICDKYVVQITPSGILVIDLGSVRGAPYVANWNASEHGSICLSSIINIEESGVVMIMVALTKNSRLQLLRVELDEFRTPFIVEDSFMLLECEPSAISLISHEMLTTTFRNRHQNVSLLCIVGSHQATLTIFDVSFAGSSIKPWPILASKDIGAVVINDDIICIPESVSWLSSKLDVILVGLRDGHLVGLELCYEDTNQLSLEQKFMKRLGVLPVNLIYMDPRDSSEIIALTDFPSRIIADARGISLSSICFEMIKHFAPFGPSQQRVLLVLSKKRLHSIEVLSHVTYNTRKLPVPGTPRRIAFDADFKELFVATDAVSKRGELIATIETLKPDASSPDHLVFQKQLPRDERILSLHLMRFEDVRYLSVGTGFEYIESSGAFAYKRGTIRVFKLIYQERLIQDFELVLEAAVDSPVAALCSIPDKGIILASNGTKLLWIETIRKRMVSFADVMRYPINSIAVKNDLILLGGANDSCMIFSADEASISSFMSSSPENIYRMGENLLAPSAPSNLLRFLHGDTHARLVSDAAFISENCIMASDRLGNLYGYSFMGDNNPLAISNLEEKCAVHVGEVCMRVRPGLFANSTQRLLSFSQIENKLEINPEDISSSFSYDTHRDKQLENIALVSKNINLFIRSFYHDRRIFRAAVFHEEMSDDAFSVKATAASMQGSIICVQSVTPLVFEILSLLQTILADFPITSPILGNDWLTSRSTHVSFRGALDGDLVDQFSMYATSIEKTRITEAWNAEWENQHSARLTEKMTVEVLMALITLLDHED